MTLSPNTCQSSHKLLEQGVKEMRCKTLPDLTVYHLFACHAAGVQSSPVMHQCPFLTSGSYQRQPALSSGTAIVCQYHNHTLSTWLLMTIQLAHITLSSCSFVLYATLGLLLATEAPIMRSLAAYTSHSIGKVLIR